MADAVLGPLFENLNSFIQREFELLWGVKAEVRKLSRTLLTIRDVLADAEVQEVKSKAVQNWLVKLKDAAYDAEDILEDWATDEPHLLLHHQAAKSDGASRNYHANRVWDSFQSLFTSTKRLKFHYNIAKKIKEIRERFDEIAKEKSDFHLKEGLVDVEGLVFTHHSISPNRETSSISKEPQIYGRNADKENIVKMLLENMNNEHVISVCPIIGIGGLGKTTLAQFIYNDDRVQKHFENLDLCVR
ncbi:hypothetical protein Sjap_006047 [Stephania japonica]|uniref:Uncharacterized protein n=1 Tax=Stephania japonica TaxID=461633 RepID=A0AAP0K6Q6_9MAGN